MHEQNCSEISVAIIGAGISGLSCATRLKALGYQVKIYEKSRGVSGRMSTRSTADWNADHGAQYFTARDPLFINELKQWIKDDVAAIWEPRLQVFKAGQWQDSASKENRYVGNPAMNTPGQYLAKNLVVKLNQTIHHIAYDQGKWLLHSQEHGAIQEQFDWLVLALPAPQALVITQSIDRPIEEVVKRANMQACWTVMATLTEKTNMPFDAAFINSEIISWLSRNNSKPNRAGMETWTIHANPLWSQVWVERDKDEAAKEILDCAKRLGLNCDAAKISIHRWRYASGHAAPISGFRLCEDLKLGYCGDWLNGGRVEGAWLSGHHLASQIQKTQHQTNLSSSL